MVIDEHLSWKSHISNVSNKISKSIGKFIKQVSSFLNHLCELFIILLFIPTQFIVTSFGRLHIKVILIEFYIILQKRIVRIMNKTWFLDQTGPLFRQGKILKIIDICSLQMDQFKYSYNH